MAIEVITKDCTALTDAEMADMADLSAESLDWGVGAISKQAQEWVLATLAFDRGSLRGFVMSTMERIGGTPAMVVGVACVSRVRNRSTVLGGLMHDQFHKARMAFPDEDVIVSARLRDAGGFDALRDLVDVRPWPETRLNGEERAWARRLAKRYGTDEFDDRTLLGVTPIDLHVFDYEATKPQDVGDVLEPCMSEEQRHVIAFGWAMAEFLDDFLHPAG